MASGDREPVKFPLPNAILLAGAVAGAIWFYQGPLQSSRPVGELESQRRDEAGDRRVQARLWQDPFEAVARHLAVEGKQARGSHETHATPHAHRLTHLVQEAMERAPAPRTVQVLVLLADGAPYADPSETRLQQRYAVLAGLERAGYVPQDGEHIRFFQWDSPHCRDASSRAYWCTADVPVEWYHSADDPSVHVLLLWIKDQDLGDRPLASLRAIQHGVASGVAAWHRSVAFTIIGPRFSGTLHNMLAESTPVSHRAADSAGGAGSASMPLEIYSPWSTAPEAFFRSGKIGNGVAATVDERLKMAGVTFRRTIHTDDRLIAVLTDELRRRGVRLGPDCPADDDMCGHVAVISEWDTLYGRALPLTLNAVAGDRSAAKTSEAFQRALDKLNEENEPRGRIHRFSYLRGLDGELPRKAKGGSGESAPEPDRAWSSLEAPRRASPRMERPEGRSQLDYVRRMADALKRKERELNDACRTRDGSWTRAVLKACAGFKAIGVLGSDVYDKLLILQALKARFPDVVFFTTDLDARLFHPGELAWTRNLVVASHFGLSLHPSLQGAVPPFRNTYQTATFYTVIRALGALRETDSCTVRGEASGQGCVPVQKFIRGDGTAEADFETVTRPKLHELGYHGPVDLSVDSEPQTDQDIQSINEPRPHPPCASDARRWYLELILVTFVGWILLMPASHTMLGLTKWAWTALRKRSLHATVMSAAVTVIGILVWWQAIPFLVSEGDKGEPFSLVDGVSIWPSQLWRGLVMVLAVAFAVRIQARFRMACRSMASEFPDLLGRERSNALMGTDPQEEGDDRRPGSGRLAQWLTGLPVGAWALDREPKDPKELWGEYLELSSPRNRWPRVVFWSLMFLFVGALLVQILGRPSVPARGEVAQTVNRWLTWASVPGMVVVIFLVLDLTRLTGAFVRKLFPPTLDALSPTQSLRRLQLVARLTDHIDMLIYYPAVLMVLMVVARSDYWDNWHTPIGLMIVIGLSAAYVVTSAVLLRRAAEWARREVVRVLARQRLAGVREQSESIAQVMTEVAALHEGAFTPFTELPVFRAVALPSGAYAAVMAVELLVNNF